VWRFLRSLHRALLALLATLSLLAGSLMAIVGAAGTNEYWPVWSGLDAQGRKTSYSIVQVRNPSRLGFHGYTELPPPEPGPATETLRNNPQRPGAYRSVKWGGFEMGAGEMGSYDLSQRGMVAKEYGYGRCVAIPLWLAVGMSLLLPTAWLRSAYRRRSCGR
jgi:hypothetical protein